MTEPTVKLTTNRAKLESATTQVDGEHAPPHHIPNEKLEFHGLCTNCKTKTMDRKLIDCRRCGHAIFWERVSIDDRKIYRPRNRS